MHLVDITMFYAAQGGGVSTYLNAKAAWLAQRSRVRHTILSTNVDSRAGTPALLRIPAIDVPGVHGYRVPLSVATPARLMRGLQPDLIEAGDAGHAAWAALRVRRQLGVPAVAFYHSDLARLVQERFGAHARRAAAAYLAHLYGQFDLVLAPSRRMVDQLAALGVHGAVQQPLGIDVRTFTPQRRSASLRHELGLAPATRLLVYAGRFSAEKKLTLLVDAVRKLGAPYHLLLIGAGGRVPRCSQVSVLPFQRDQRVLARLLAGCDLLVQPGDCETFGLIVPEAMACGLPVVGTSGGSVAELIDDSSGIVVAPNSIDSLAQGIAAIYGMDLAAMARAASRRAHQQYDWNRIMPQLMNRYAGLLASRARADLESGRVCAAD
jgi:alpha-1,6-mannosyltransferase